MFDVPQNGSVSESLTHTSGHRLVRSPPRVCRSWGRYGREDPHLHTLARTGAKLATGNQIRQGVSPRGVPAGLAEGEPGWGEGGVGAYNGHTHCTHDKRKRRAELRGGKGLLINSMDLAPDQSALNQLWKGRGRALGSQGSEGKLRPRPHGGDRMQRPLSNQV